MPEAPSYGIPASQCSSPSRRTQSDEQSGSLSPFPYACTENSILPVSLAMKCGICSQLHPHHSHLLFAKCIQWKHAKQRKPHPEFFRPATLGKDTVRRPSIWTLKTTKTIHPPPFQPVILRKPELSAQFSQTLINFSEEQPYQRHSSLPRNPRHDRI